MRKPMIVGNWKMNKVPSEAVRLAKQLKVLVSDDTRSVEVVLCPAFTALQSVGDVLKGTGILLGAQNVHWAEEGAFTGEVSAAMLKDISCAYVIVGHSERREHFGEEDDVVRRKVDAVLHRGMGVIACVGESLAERHEGRTEEVIMTEVRALCENLSLDDPADLVIAYEPIWAIGTGETATSLEAGRIARLIRDECARWLGSDIADHVRILYGGSVKPDNIAGFMAEASIDGALVGGASLDASSFAQIVRY